MNIEVGDEARDFTLRDQNNEEFTLAAQRGDKAVLIVFYPLAFTGICTGELKRVREDPATFSTDAVETVSISCDSVYAQKIYSQREGFEFRLLSDFWPHGGVAQLYGAFNERAGFADRATVLIDRAGIVRFTEHYGPGDGRDADVWRAAIKALS